VEEKMRVPLTDLSRITPEIMICKAVAIAQEKPSNGWKRAGTSENHSKDPLSIKRVKGRVLLRR